MTTISQMSSTEFREYLAAKQANIAREFDRIRSAPKASPDPRSRGQYQSLRTMDHFCALVVVHDDLPHGPNGRKVSMNGDPNRAFSIPRDQIIVQPETTDRFLLATVPKWLTKPDKGGRRRLPQLTGVIPPLTESIEWSDEDRTIWESLRTKASCINTRIRNAGRRFGTSLRYGETA